MTFWVNDHIIYYSNEDPSDSESGAYEKAGRHNMYKQYGQTTNGRKEGREEGGGWKEGEGDKK